MTLQLSQTNTHLEPLDPADLDVHPLLRDRASLGSFSADTLAWHQILQLLQAARCAPSSHNSQPWHFIVVQAGPGRQEIDDDLIAWGAPWAARAPVLIAVITSLQEGTEYHGLNYALFDCGLAVQNVLLQAADMGLAAHPVGYKDEAVVRRVLNLQPDHSLVLFVAVGNLDGEPVTTNASRLRKPLELIATCDRWGGVPVIE